MRILFLTYCRAVLGANISMISLIKDLRERYQVESCVVIPDVIDGDLEKILIEEEIDYMVHPMKPWVVSENASHKILRCIWIYFKNLIYTNSLFKKLKGSKFQIVYSNNSTIQLGSYIAEKMHIPHVWHIREFGKKDYSIIYCCPKWFVRRRYKKASRVITISHELFKEIVREYHLSNAIMIYNGVGMETIAKEKINLDDELRFCNVGAIQSGKNQLELLQATKLLIEGNVDNLHIYIVGDGSEYREQLEEYCKDNGLEKYVTFCGYQSDIPEILRKMDVGVICSNSEAFGRVTCEYMCASMPVIGAASGGTVEIIEDGINGFLYAAGEVQMLAEKMQLLIKDRKCLKFMSENAYQQACSKFTLKKNTDEIYKELCDVIAK